METFTSKIDFIKRSFGEIHIARDEKNIAVKCPSCRSGTKKKFSINTDNWNCHCWVCGIKGKNLYSILLKHVDRDLAEEYRSRFIGTSKKIDEDFIKEKRLSLPKGFVPLCMNINSQDPDIKDCLSYLKKRGIKESDLWYFKIGATKTGRFRRRIIIPSFDMFGEINYFSGRSIDEDSFLKYLNSSSKKKDIIFNEINIDWKKELTIVEGPFDLFRSNENTTCLLGSSLSKGSYLFKRIISNRTPVLLSLDSDMKEKSLRIADTLLKYGCDVRILDTGEYSDVGEMTKKEFLKRKKNAKSWTRKISLKEKISSIRTGSLF